MGYRSQFTYKGMKIKGQYYDSIRDAKRDFWIYNPIVLAILLGPPWFLWISALFRGRLTGFGIFATFILCLFWTLILFAPLITEYRQIKELEQKEKEITKKKETIPFQAPLSPPTPSAISPAVQLSTEQASPLPSKAKPENYCPQKKTVSHVVCGRCGKAMVIRTNRYTKKKFWGCSGYPLCTFTRDMR